MAGQLIHCPNCQHPIEIPQPKLTWEQSLKVKTTDALKWCGRKIAETWQSGRKGKIICIETAIILILAIFLMAERGRTHQYSARLEAFSQAETSVWEAPIPRLHESPRRVSSSTGSPKEKPGNTSKTEEQSTNNPAQMESTRERELAGKEQEERAAREQLEREQVEKEHIAREQTKRERATQERTKQHSAQCINSITASDLALVDFKFVFIGGDSSDEGMVFAHEMEPCIQVLQSTSTGMLVHYVEGTSREASSLEQVMKSKGATFERIIWVESESNRQEEGQSLKSGFYVRCGLYTYTDTDGGEHTLGRYVAVTDQKTVSLLKAEWKRRAQEEENEEENAENACEPIELDVPIKSLCGFMLGAAPKQIKPLILNDDGSLVKIIGRTEYGVYRLVTPFRVFSEAELRFTSKAYEKHLSSVVFKAFLSRDEYTDESIAAEMKTIVQMLEKKFGIQFKVEVLARYSDNTPSWFVHSWSYNKDDTHRESISFEINGENWSLSFSSGAVEEIEKLIKESNKKTLVTDTNTGMEQL